MKKLKIGTHVKLKKSYTKWLSEHSNDLFGYPHMIRPERNTLLGYKKPIEDQLSTYFMNRYSGDRGMEIHGVVIGDNDYNNEDYAVLVWCGNDLGEDTCYIEPINLKVLS